MSYVALYRKWRPKDFEQLVGQEHISMTLKNAILSNRIAHAYLFSGPRGTGKTSTAKIFAKSLNCVQGPTIEPCGICDSCQRIADGRSMDVLEIDAASNRGIDEIRELREKVKFTPVDGRYKVYIIDEVHMLTTEAFNALLKTLEEPPAHVIFILATTEQHRIPATILSRCQRYEFRRIADEDIEERLHHITATMAVTIEPEALRVIARAAEGGLRDALSIMDQCLAFGGTEITTEQVRSMLGLAGEEWLDAMVSALLQQHTVDALKQIQMLFAMGKDPRQVLVELVNRFRTQLIAETTSPGIKTMDSEECMAIIQMLSEAIQEAKWAPQPRLVLEMTAIKICRRQQGNQDLAPLLTRIEALEQLLKNRPADKRLQTVGNAGGTETQNRAITPSPDTAPALTLSAPEEPIVKKSNTIQKSETPQHVGELWERILADLLKNNKRAIHTCLAEGRLISVSEDAVLISFQLPFYKERVEKEDYRGFLEKLFAQITGKTRQIKCCIEQEMAEDSRSEVTPPVAPEDAVIQNAVEMFGEHIVTIKK